MAFLFTALSSVSLGCELCLTKFRASLHCKQQQQPLDSEASECGLFKCDLHLNASGEYFQVRSLSHVAYSATSDVYY